MDILFNLGINDNDLKIILGLCPNILDMGIDEINEKIDILYYVGCNERHIRNIIICNPYYLELFNEDILNLIRYFKGIGVSNINLLFDSNPFLLNKDYLEIKEYVDSKLSSGMELSDIVDELESNPYIIDEY